ncbi:MAG: hypothetical protein PHN45_07215 [Methylococcales bacterium]|nr:hypothetical protein [Methylococcales bacterium]MDD5754525.1 hypothetical protein [Methylococcales bacterium]
MNIWYLIKFFTEETHADQFIKGDLYLNRVSYFKYGKFNYLKKKKFFTLFQNFEKCDCNDDGRADRSETTASLLQLNQSKVVINFGNEKVILEEGNEGETFSVAPNEYDNHHLFCMYAVRTFDLKCVNGHVICDSIDEDEILKKQLEIDERCFKFGKFAVIVSASKFFSHLKKSLEKQEYKGVCRLVDYYDKDLFHGHFQQNEAPFKKQKKFSYQNEFRILIKPKTFDGKAIVIDVGDMSSFTIKTESYELPKILEKLVVKDDCVNNEN